MNEQLHNWAGNITFHATHLHRPETVAEVQEVVRSSRKVRVLGSAHSFNAIADSSEHLLCLNRLTSVCEVDHERQTATVAAGMTYGELCRRLYEAGYALPNTASLPHITVAGACATATHGSGNDNRCLAASVTAATFVAASGDIITLSREQDSDWFAGVVVSLGGLGVVTHLTFAIEPAFMVQQTVYENLPWGQVEAHFAEIMGSGYSVSLFTDWRGDRINQTWVKRRVTSGEHATPERSFFEATPATRNLHPLPILSAGSCTPQMGIVGPWHERLPHFVEASRQRNGDELQSEYFVPRTHAVPALCALNTMRDEISVHLQVSEVRTIAADDLWMSPFYGRDCVALHFTWKKDWKGVQQLLPRIEAALAPFEPAPHWGKLFTMPTPDVQARYTRLSQFRELLDRYDPEGTFRNAFLETYIFGEPKPV